MHPYMKIDDASTHSHGQGEGDMPSGEDEVQDKMPASLEKAEEKRFKTMTNFHKTPARARNSKGFAETDKSTRNASVDHHHMKTEPSSSHAQGRRASWYASKAHQNQGIIALGRGSNAG